MARSFWKCMFAPLGSARCIAQLESDLEGARTEATQATDQVRSLQSELARKEQALEQAKRENGDLRFEVLEGEAALNDLRRELREAQVEQEDYLRVEQALEQFESLKEKYEERIRALKSHLADARRAISVMRRPEFEDAPEPIDMKTYKPDTAHAKSPQSGQTRRDEGDWLQQLPENL